MQPILEKLVLSNEYSFKMHHAIHPHFITPWHYHPEHEIMLIEESKGMRFVGDHIESFNPGDLVFIGKNLPHYWRNDDLYYTNNINNKAHALVIQFSEEFWEYKLTQLPEAMVLRNLFNKVHKGIKFYGQTKIQLIKKIRQLENFLGFERFIAFCNILHQMATTKEYTLLSSDIFVHNYSCRTNKRLNKIFKYILENFTKKISLKEVASIANMSETNFCRYFKIRTHKSFITYLNEIRIGFACKLLTEKELSISQVCYESGFNNISNFNEQFKKHTGTTPSQYLKHHIK